MPSSKLLAAPLSALLVTALTIESASARATTLQPTAAAPAAAPQPYAQPGAPTPQPTAPPTYTPPPTAGPLTYGPPTYGPPPGPYGPPPPPPPRPGKKMMVAGWTMFGSAYLGTALIAAIVHDACNSAECRRASSLGLVPLIGPFLMFPSLDAGEITPRLALAVPALVQIAGLTLGIVGTVQFVRSGRQPAVADAGGLRLGRRARLGVAPTRFLDGGTLTLGYRF